MKIYRMPDCSGPQGEDRPSLFDDLRQDAVYRIARVLDRFHGVTGGYDLPSFFTQVGETQHNRHNACFMGMGAYLIRTVIPSGHVEQYKYQVKESGDIASIRQISVCLDGEHHVVWQRRRSTLRPGPWWAAIVQFSDEIESLCIAECARLTAESAEREAKQIAANQRHNRDLARRYRASLSGSKVPATEGDG